VTFLHFKSRREFPFISSAEFRSQGSEWWFKAKLPRLDWQAAGGAGGVSVGDEAAGISIKAVSVAAPGRRHQTPHAHTTEEASNASLFRLCGGGRQHEQGLALATASGLSS